MSRIKNNPFEELFRAMTAQILAAAKELAVGTVSSVSGNGIGITIDGDSSGAKKYTCNRAARFSSGDRVLCARESGTWVVICKIGAPGGPDAKTSAMTQAVGVDENGKLYTTPPGAYNLPTASTTQLGGIKTSEAYSSTKHTAKVAVNTSGVLYAEAYSLPTAGASTLGGVKPVAKTTAMTQDVGVDSAGKLYTTPPGAYDLPTASTAQLGGVKTSEAYSSLKHTLTVAVNASGQLYAEKPSGGSAYVTELSTSASSDTYNVKLTSGYQLIPSHNNSITRFALGTSSNPWGDAYLGYYGTVMIGNNSTTYAKLGFFGHTANVKQTLSLTSQNMGYSSVTAANYLVALNNLIGILREKHGLIG